MLIVPERSSRWMIELQKQLIRGRHVLLYGNVADQFLLNGSYLSLSQFLSKYFCEEGYRLVGRYDIVDGLRLSDPSAMRPLFESLVSSALGGDPAVPAPAKADAPSPAPGATPPARRVPRAGSGPREGEPRMPDQALHAIRLVLSQAEVGVAMAVHFSDQLVGDPGRQ